MFDEERLKSFKRSLYKHCVIVHSFDKTIEFTVQTGHIPFFKIVICSSELKPNFFFYVRDSRQQLLLFMKDPFKVNELEELNADLRKSLLKFLLFNVDNYGTSR